MSKEIKTLYYQENMPKIRLDYDIWIQPCRNKFLVQVWFTNSGWEPSITCDSINEIVAIINKETPSFPFNVLKSFQYIQYPKNQIEILDLEQK